MSRAGCLIACVCLSGWTVQCGRSGQGRGAPDGGDAAAGGPGAGGVGSSAGAGVATAGTGGGLAGTGGATAGTGDGAAGAGSGGSAIDAPPMRDAPVADADADAGTDAPVTPPGPVDPATLAKKHLLGYQGWHFAPGDGSPYGAWKHWFIGNTPSAAEVHIDIWPDLSEFPKTDLFVTQIDGAGLTSAYTAATVDRHFAWMEEHHIDGVFLQRFANELTGAAGQARDAVGSHVKASAEAHGRVFAIMYDISGANEATLEAR
jgi:hypothetical protein